MGNKIGTKSDPYQHIIDMARQIDSLHMDTYFLRRERQQYMDDVFFVDDEILTGYDVAIIQKELEIHKLERDT